jgi:hypothetical protein
MIHLKAIYDQICKVHQNLSKNIYKIFINILSCIRIFTYTIF